MMMVMLMIDASTWMSMAAKQGRTDHLPPKSEKLKLQMMAINSAGPWRAVKDTCSLWIDPGDQKLWHLGVGWTRKRGNLNLLPNATRWWGPLGSARADEVGGVIKWRMLGSCWEVWVWDKIFPDWCQGQCPTGTRAQPATRYFFRYPTRLSFENYWVVNNQILLHILGEPDVSGITRYFRNYPTFLSNIRPDQILNKALPLGTEHWSGQNTDSRLVCKSQNRWLHMTKMRWWWGWILLVGGDLQNNESTRHAALLSFHWVAVGNNPMIGLLVHAPPP